MSNPLTDVRQQLAAVLTAADLGVPVHTYPPGSITGPCVVLYPGDPWLTPRGHVSFVVTCYASTTTNQGAMARLEQLSWDVAAALATTGNVGWGDFSAPSTDATSQLSSCTIQTVTRP